MRSANWKSYVPKPSLRDLAWYRRQVAVHEAGHVLVARSLGVKSAGYVWLRENPQPGETLFCGIAHLPGIQAMPREAKRKIGLAGAAAQLTWMRLPSDQFHSFVSQSDWRDVGIEPGHRKDREAALSKTLKFLMSSMKRGTPGWSDLIREARQLIITSREESNAETVAFEQVVHAYMERRKVRERR